MVLLGMFFTKSRKRGGEITMNRLIIGSILVMFSVFTGNSANAALSCAFGTLPGYNTCYNGVQSGFITATDDSLMMSSDPTVHDPVPVNGAITISGTILTYDDVMANPSLTKWGDSTIYSEMGWLIAGLNMWVLDPSMSTAELTASAMEGNTVIFAIVDPQFPLPSANATRLLSGAGKNANYNWANDMRLFETTNGDEYLISNLTLATPVPPAAWLFASGLIGLVGVSRRKASIPR